MNNFPWLHISINTERENELQVLFPLSIDTSGVHTFPVSPEVYQDLLTFLRKNQEKENSFTIARPSKINLDLSTLELDF